jgi:cell division protein ZapA
MGQIQVTINNRNYSIACDDGEEAHVGRLARYVERKVAGLVSSLGQIGDARLLLMASLIVADELSEAEKTLNERGAQNGEGSARLSSAAESDLAGALDGLAQRIEAIAARFERD